MMVEDFISKSNKHINIYNYITYVFIIYSYDSGYYIPILYAILSYCFLQSYSENVRIQLQN